MGRCWRALLNAGTCSAPPNGYAPAIDGMSVDELPEHLKHHWLRIKAELLAGRYRPQPVRRVEIPKPAGAYVRW